MIDALWFCEIRKFSPAPHQTNSNHGRGAALCADIANFFLPPLPTKQGVIIVEAPCTIDTVWFCEIRKICHPLPSPNRFKSGTSLSNVILLIHACPFSKTSIRRAFPLHPILRMPTFLLVSESLMSDPSCPTLWCPTLDVRPLMSDPLMPHPLMFDPIDVHPTLSDVQTSLRGFPSSRLVSQVSSCSNYIICPLSHRLWQLPCASQWTILTQTRQWACQKGARHRGWVTVQDSLQSKYGKVPMKDESLHVISLTID